MGKLIILLSLLILQSCEFRYVVAANFAKEYCSCIFVVERGEDSCYEQSKQFVTPNFSVLKDNKEVEASFLWAKTSARYLGKKYGCLLEKSYLDRM